MMEMSNRHPAAYVIIAVIEIAVFIAKRAKWYARIPPNTIESAVDAEKSTHPLVCTN